MDAALVGIMKEKKMMAFDDLCREVEKRLEIFDGGIDEVLLRKRLAHLIELEYISRDEYNRQVFYYRM